MEEQIVAQIVAPADPASEQGGGKRPASALELVARLRERQADTERDGQYSAELRDEMERIGIYKQLSDGLAAPDLVGYLESISFLASGCPSTAWSVATGTAHQLSVAQLFDDGVQAQLLGNGKTALICAGGTARGSVSRVDDGWHIRGEWEQCDGVPYADWFLARVVFTEDAHGTEPVRVGTALVPRAQIEVLDDWHDVLGLRGAGSNSIRADTVVPVEFVILQDHLNLDSGRPGVACLIPAVAAAVARGVARSAIEWYDEMIRVRKTFFPPQVLRVQDINYQRYYGTAVTSIEAAAAVIDATASLHSQLIDDAKVMQPAIGEELQLIGRYHAAFQQCWGVIQFLFTSGGSSAASNDSTMGRYFRDLSTLRTRSDLQHDAYARDLSRQHYELTEASA